MAFGLYDAYVALKEPDNARDALQNFGDAHPEDSSAKKAKRLISELPAVQAHEARVRWGLLVFHVALFGGAVLALGDTLSAIFGALLVVILYRKRCRPFYLIMGVLVLYIELVGTALGCWVWDPAPFGVLRTTNPPVGAFVCYVIADILVMKISAFLVLRAPIAVRQAFD